MRFLADVNVSVRVVEHLQSHGLQVIRVPEILDPRSPDQEILAEARRRQSTLISFDQDFSAMLAVSGATVPSLINLRVTYIEAERLAAAIIAIVRVADTDLLAGAVVTLDDAGVRVHRLPLT